MSIKGKLIRTSILMFLILGFFACLIMRNALNNMQQLRVIQDDISELDLITRIHSGINRQLREGILYLVSLQPRALDGFRESGVVVKSSLAQWAKFTKSSGIIKDEEERLKAVKYIENKYNLVMQDFKQAFALAEFGHKQEALSLIKGNTEPGAPIILFEEFEQEIGDQIDKFKDTHDNALLGMVFMPWVAGKNRDNLRFAREITRTFINIDRLNAAINRQAGEAIVYLIASDKEDKSEIIRPNPEIARLFREWRRDTQAGVGLSTKEAAQKLKDIETIEAEYAESVTFLGQANALKASGDNEQMLGVLGRNLESLLDDTLLVRISAASTEAKLAIALRHEKLFNSTFYSALQGVTVLLGIFILIILVYIKLIRGMIISLNKLEAGTKVIAKGDLEHWIDLKYKDELGELASSFNKMAQDLQKSKKEIVHAKDYTEKILRSMNDALIVVSPPGEIQIVNTATCNLLGYKEEELVGQPFRKILKQGQMSFVSSWLDNLVLARFIRNIEEIYVSKDGREIPVLFAGSLMLDDNGSVIGIVCAAQDITERKQAEEILRKAKDDLEIKVAERTVELKDANEKLQFELAERKKAESALKKAYSELKNTQQELMQTEKLAALGRFSLGIAHEVKNPLGIILGGVEFLENKLRPEDQVIKTAISKIKEAIFSANIIVTGLLKFARPSELKREKLNPKDLINDALSLLKYRAPLGNITIKTEFSSEVILIEADRNQMQQVIFDLMNNSIEAMPGGGQITIKTYKSTLSQFSENSLDCVIEIIDTGEGILRENLSKLFEPFFTTKRDRRGTGLGLSIAKTIVKNHRGDIMIESEAGRGTSVKIILPLTM